MITKPEETNKEQAILEAAEHEFLDKGYAASRTTQIAQRAGVTHAMLHYYFRTKENIFNKVFEEKVRLISSSFFIVLAKDLPFMERLKQVVEAHFDFLAENPKLPSFLLREILSSPERKEVFKELLVPKIINIIAIMEKEISAETEKGTIINISPADLLLNVASLNAASVVASLIVFENEDEQTQQVRQSFLRERKASTVDFVMRSLRP